MHAMLACACGTSEHTQHMRNACGERALGLPHCKCGTATGTVAVGNEMQLFCN